MGIGLASFMSLFADVCGGAFRFGACRWVPLKFSPLVLSIGVLSVIAGAEFTTKRVKPFLFTLVWIFKHHTPAFQRSFVRVMFNHRRIVAKRARSKPGHGSRGLCWRDPACVNNSLNRFTTSTPSPTT